MVAISDACKMQRHSKVRIYLWSKFLSIEQYESLLKQHAFNNNLMCEYKVSLENATSKKLNVAKSTDAYKVDPLDEFPFCSRREFNFS